MLATRQIVERQAPSNYSQAWEDSNFTGLYTASNSTFLAAYWHQNITNASQELVVLFQEADFANSITQARYVGNSTTSNPWVAQPFPFSQPEGRHSPYLLRDMQPESTSSYTQLMKTAFCSSRNTR